MFIALTLNRTLLHPCLACYCDRDSSAMLAGLLINGCKLPSAESENYLPFTCLPEQVIDSNAWWAAARRHASLASLAALHPIPATLLDHPFPVPEGTGRGVVRGEVRGEVRSEVPSSTTVRDQEPSATVRVHGAPAGPWYREQGGEVPAAELLSRLPSPPPRLIVPVLGLGPRTSSALSPLLFPLLSSRSSVLYSSPTVGGACVAPIGISHCLAPPRAACCPAHGHGRGGLAAQSRTGRWLVHLLCPRHHTNTTASIWGGMAEDTHRTLPLLPQFLTLAALPPVDRRRVMNDKDQQSWGRYTSQGNLCIHTHEGGLCQSARVCWDFAHCPSPLSLYASKACEDGFPGGSL